MLFIRNSQCANRRTLNVLSKFGRRRRHVRPTGVRRTSSLLLFVILTLASLLLTIPSRSPVSASNAYVRIDQIYRQSDGETTWIYITWTLLQKWSPDATAVYPSVNGNLPDNSMLERSLGLNLDQGPFMWKPIGTGGCNTSGPGPDDYVIGQQYTTRFSKLFDPSTSSYVDACDIPSTTGITFTVMSRTFFDSPPCNMERKTASADPEIYPIPQPLIPNPAISTPLVSCARQLRSNGLTPIAEEEITPETALTFKACLLDPHGLPLKFRIELRRHEDPFTGIFDGGIIESPPVNSGDEATVTLSGLVGGLYHWRASTVNSQGEESAWQEFRRSGNVDVIIGSPGPFSNPILVSQLLGQTLNHEAIGSSVLAGQTFVPATLGLLTQIDTKLFTGFASCSGGVQMRIWKLNSPIGDMRQGGMLIATSTNVVLPESNPALFQFHFDHVPIDNSHYYFWGVSVREPSCQVAIIGTDSDNVLGAPWMLGLDTANSGFTDLSGASFYATVPLSNFVIDLYEVIHAEAPASSDLSVSTTAAPNPVMTGSNIVYEITVTNHGPGNSKSVELKDILDPNTTFQSITKPQDWLCTKPAVSSTGTINCTAPEMLANSSATFTIVVNVSCSAMNSTVINTATASSSTDDVDLTNNSDTQMTTAAARTSSETIQLRTMWSNEGYWKPETYTDHTPSGSTFAADFYYTARNRPDIFRVGEPGVGSRTIFAPHSGRAYLYLYDVTRVPHAVRNFDGPLDADRIIAGGDVPQHSFKFNDGTQIREIDVELVIDVCSFRTLYAHLQVADRFFTPEVSQKIREAISFFRQDQANQGNAIKAQAIDTKQSLNIGEKIGTTYHWGLARSDHLHFQIFNRTGFSELSPKLGDGVDLSSKANQVLLEGQPIIDLGLEYDLIQKADPKHLYQYPAMPRRRFSANELVVVNTAWDGLPEVNLRQTPGGDVLTQISEGTQGQILDERSEVKKIKDRVTYHVWWKVQFPNAPAGWIAAEYIDHAP